MTENSERKAQFVFEQRGYLVISSFERLEIGQVIDGIGWGLNYQVEEKRDHKLVVISETDEDDHEAQAQLAGVMRWKNPVESCRYYRVVAE